MALWKWAGLRWWAWPGGVDSLYEWELVGGAYQCHTLLDSAPSAISHASDLAPLAACPRLARLRLVGTPLAAAPEAAAQLDKLLPHVAVTLA